MSQPTKITVADVIADRFITSLQNGVAPWQKPWVSVSPQNGVSRKPYSGVNAFTLAFYGSDDYYLTFNQIKALGGQLEAGTKGLPITYFAAIEDKKKPLNSNGKADKFLLARYYTVFPVNKANLPDFKRANKVITFTPVEAAEKLAGLNKTPVTFGGNSAHFDPRKKTIGMPRPESFKSIEQYYATLFHEIGHSLMEGEKHNTDMFSKEYAKEELVAELFSSICLNETGLLATTAFDNSSAYIANWLTALSNDKTLIQKAASEAFKRWKRFNGEVAVEQEVTA